MALKIYHLKIISAFSFESSKKTLLRIIINIISKHKKIFNNSVKDTITKQKKIAT
jgi:hypothetical protein